MKKRILKFRLAGAVVTLLGVYLMVIGVRRHLVADDCHDRADFWYCDLDDGQTGGL